jgi:hypothetical protein
VGSNQVLAPFFRDFTGFTNVHVDNETSMVTSEISRFVGCPSEVLIRIRFTYVCS